jgi:hypothetical protein
VVEAACPPPARSPRPPTVAALDPDRHRVVVKAARRGMVAGARLGGGVNAGPRPPSYSSSSSYRPPWSMTTSSFSSMAPCGSTTTATTGRWPQQQHGRQEQHRIVHQGCRACGRATPMPCPTPPASAAQRGERKREERMRCS